MNKDNIFHFQEFPVTNNHLVSVHEEREFFAIESQRTKGPLNSRSKSNCAGLKHRSSQQTTSSQDRAGVLYKRGYWNPSWRKRFFELSPRGELEYFEARGDCPHGALLGAIPIAMPAGCSGSDHETLVRPAGREGSKYLFEVVVQGPGPAQGRTFVLAATNRADRDRWVRKLAATAAAWRFRRAEASEESGTAGRPLAGRDGKFMNALADLDRLMSSGGASRAHYAARKAQLLREWQPAEAAASATPAPWDDGKWRMEGLLRKRGQWNTGWKERYFVLTPRGDLEYYAATEGVREGPPLGVIPVALRPGCSGDTEETVVRAEGRDSCLNVVEITVKMPGPNLRQSRSAGPWSFRELLMLGTKKGLLRQCPSFSDC